LEHAGVGREGFASTCVGEFAVVGTAYIIDAIKGKMNKLLQDKVVLITGGARGLGAATACVCASHGAHIAVNYATSKGKALAVVDQIRAMGVKANVYGADVRHRDEVELMVKAVQADFGRIDGLVNNALSGKHNGLIDEMTDADYDSAFAYGCKATLNTIKAVRPIMAAQGGGRVINIVTEMWNSAPDGWTAYMAGKGAMVGISRSLARELGPQNITVNMVSPGWMVDEKVDGESEMSKGFAKSIPLGIHGTADEIGKACVFYLSELSSFVTGTYLPVTGGRVTQVGM
jgi:3-oxoacyl-[acyl-carrier protein] reductase